MVLPISVFTKLCIFDYYEEDKKCAKTNIMTKKSQLRQKHVARSVAVLLITHGLFIIRTNIQVTVFVIILHFYQKVV